MAVSNEATAENVKRRLAAVLSADVEGFSRLCGEDEAGTLRTLERHLDEVVEPAVSEQHGRITSRVGDGILAEFGSAVAAVKAAVDIQARMIARNAGVEEGRRLRFRIGLNLCEVVVRDSEIFGDGVNIAARAQTQALPDSVCATEAVVQQVRGKIGVIFRSMGKLQLKNIVEPVHLYRLDPSNSDEEPAGNRGAASAAESRSRPSVAVLPFTNLSGDPDQGYFSDGITEDLITDLSRFRTISVIARNSSFGYRGGAVDVRKVANELGVRFVVEGSVRKMSDSVRITVQLVNAETRHHIWADRYDVPLAELFRTQDEIIRHIIGRLVPRIEDASLEIARRQPTEMLQAYDYYLRGKAVLNAATDAAGAGEARHYFEQAIAIDPAFAYPYCYLVRILNNVTMYAAPGRPLGPFREQAWRYARIAASLDDADPHTHICLAWCHLWRGEFEPARKHLETAEALNPNDADRAMDRGTGWVYLGEIDRALECMQTGMRLNPLHPYSYLADLAEAYFVAERYDDALQLLERIPDQSLLTPAWKAAAYGLCGNRGRAEAEASRFVANLRAAWAGDPAAGPEDYVAWVLSLCPFARVEDRDRLLSGLRLAGLPASLSE